MKLAVLSACLLLFCSAALAKEETHLRNVSFPCDPQDAQIYLEVSGQAPYLLGDGLHPVALDLDQFIGHSNRLIYRRAGWRDAEKTVEAYYFSLEDSNRNQFPDPNEGPVTLTALTDSQSRMIQLQWHIKNHWMALTVLTVAIPGLVVTALRRKKLAPAPDTSQLPLESADALSWELTPGMSVGNYRVLRRLGEGVTAVVYEVEEISKSGPTLALKLIKPGELRGVDSLARFRREMKAMVRLSHPGIPFLADFDEFRGMPYLVMEMLSGPSLRERLDSGPMPPLQALEVFARLTETLAFAHQIGVLHRDLKPDNILFADTESESTRVYLTDFGLARSHDSTTMTAEGSLLGTPLYMAPELMQGEATSAKSDQYSLGCVAFEMFAGRPPFQGDSPLAIAVQHVHSEIPELRSLCPDLPVSAESVLAIMLDKDPQQRYASLDKVPGLLRQ